MSQLDTNSLDGKWSLLSSPVRYAFQDRAATRLAEHGQPPRRSMWAYVGYELRRSRWMSAYRSDYPSLLRDVILMIDFTGSNWQRLERVRVPSGAPGAVTAGIATGTTCFTT